ncbi:hypothetical protein GR160_06090 [Flavobacterium sp. Sd200]|uniref:hypothetical protein n=1 Tax=Flavobacterium sp. Sd200 TaxID=2692211 RepID=UPI001370750C|nr:hypothetical protein [Flavobacterium sp. Sd200]MXN90791.1 hypothetical protein [Flavobacterium sp. Sd200]
MSDLNADFSISLTTAREYATKWRKENSGYDRHNKLHAFLIPKDNLEALLKEDIDAVRAYLGVDENGVEKLMIVGTKWSPATETQDDKLPLLGTKLEGKIYDFTLPCPRFCGHKSALNELDIEI